MNHTISPDRRTLTIRVTPEEQAELRSNCDFAGDKHLHDFLQPLTCNSELEWIGPADTGDLTDAPMLGILGEETLFSKLPPHLGYHQTRRAENNNVLIIPILERWAFMDYQVRNVLEDLRDKGECVFVGGGL